MSRPGMTRRISSRVDMNAAWGPPKPMGTPKRCADPMQMSAPISPGGLNRLKARRSAANVVTAPAFFALAAISERSSSRPVVDGYWSNTPKTSALMDIFFGSTTRTSIPRGCARVLTTPMVWGWTSSATTKTLRSPVAVA